MGTVDTGGTGCVCPEHVMLKAILSNLVFRKDDVVIMDMEAGLEHLGRGTASMMDQFIVVIEPGARSIQTYEAHQVSLPSDIGITKRARCGQQGPRRLRPRVHPNSRIPEDDLLGFISYNSERHRRRPQRPFSLRLQPRTRWKRSAPSRQGWTAKRMNLKGMETIDEDIV